MSENPFSPDKLAELYESAIFILPPECQFRQYDFRFGTDRVLPLRKTIRSPLELRKFALEKLPSAIYVSKHYQVQAKNRSRLHKVRRKGGKRDLAATVSDDLILGGDFVLDFDAKHFSSLTSCRAEVLKVREYILSHRNSFPGNNLEVIFSGRGFYIWLYGFWHPEIEREQNAKNRINMYSAALRRATRILLKEGFRFDIPPALNPRQVFRVKGSFNHHNMEKVHSIDALSVRLTCPDSETNDVTGKEKKEKSAIYPQVSRMINVPQNEKSRGEGFNKRGKNYILPAMLREARLPAKGDET